MTAATLLVIELHPPDPVRRGLLGTGLSAGALVVALVNAEACLVLVGLVALYFAFPARAGR